MDGPSDEAAANDGIVAYQYNALKKEASTLISKSHYEDESRKDYHRKVRFEQMAHQNMVSAVPIIISQHLSYHYCLELLKGVFEFSLDCRGKLWLINASNLHFIPSAVHGNDPASNGQGAGHKESGVKKLFRYMSEEALQNKEVDAATGEKYTRMLDEMNGNYRALKEEFAIDELLQACDEVPDFNIPVFIGTDRKALFEAFGLHTGESAADASRQKVDRSKASFQACKTYRPCSARPVYPASRDVKILGDGPARQRVMTPRANTPAGGWRPHGSVPTRPHSSQGKPLSARRSVTLEGIATPQKPASPRPKTRPQPGQRPQNVSRQLSCQSNATESSAKGRTASKGSAPSSSGVHEALAKITQLGYEIVPSLEVPRMLAGAGPYMLPEGPTLHQLGPPSLKAPISGVQTRSSATKSKLCLLKPHTKAKTEADQESKLRRMGSRSNTVRLAGAERGASKELRTALTSSTHTESRTDSAIEF